ncbi:MAG: hypothetical protein QMD94_03485 [Candidatus Omnitrophota bacterium]|nr:hypothetical protein [Candidatus Omnitrophota bacterium]
MFKDTKATSHKTVVSSPLTKAKSFVIIMLVISVLAVILRFGIKKLIEVNIARNESSAQLTLKLISTALENYANSHNSVYPESLSNLTESKPPYLEKDYTHQASFLKNYDYNCFRLTPSGYSCSAIPAKCNLTGKISYTISTGGILLSEDCKK